MAQLANLVGLLRKDTVLPSNNRFGQVADKVMRQSEELGVQPRFRGLADKARLGGIERKCAGQRGQGPAALGIFGRREIVLHQAQLAVARRGQQQRVNEGGEAVHGDLSRRDRGRAMPPADKLARGVMIHHLSIAARDPKQAAAVLAEKLKVWKGEPFERAMVNFYLGLIYYIQQDYGNARAAFENALKV